MNNYTAVKTLQNKIINETNSKIQHLKKGAKIESSTKIIMLIEGDLSIRRCKDGILMSRCKAPAIFGLIGVFKPDYHSRNYFRCETDCVIYIYSTPSVIDAINKENLWYHVSANFAHLIEAYCTKNLLVMHNDVYGIVSSHLEDIWALPEEERLKVSIFNFIMQRAPISRSSIHKIIKELNKGGFIKTERGKLLNLTNIPRGF
ncbi:TPA: helix-turn-helix domain-containing protein [Serratia liquefaciens]|nr:helix-turn-helix domain-containing protein [Serratia liquefaciens]